MHRLTKLLFWVSDILAWLLVAFALLIVVTYPITGPIWARMDHQQLAISSIVVTCLLWLCVALGAYLITRRRAFGIALIAIPWLAAFPSGQWLTGLLAVTILALVFGLPFVLALLGSRPATPGSAP